ncbi:MAG: hypothetical protein HY268_26505 [Deltaproteobacteria bacterium]|nr:hypothetical protein [Deltaproteobacteria bacterium]
MTQYVYAGAAPFSGGSDTTQPGGLFRLAVGSNEWQPLRQGFPDQSEVRAIAIHPHNPQIVYAGAQDGPYRSQDGGNHWERLNFPEKDLVVWSILFHPKNPQIMYLGTAPTAIYRSDNGGESWKRLPIIDPVGLVRMGFPCRIIRLAIDPTNPDELYAGLEVGGVIRSLDGGETWNDCTKELIKFTQQEHLQSQLISDTNREGVMDSHALVVSAARPGTVFLATRMGLFCSTDRGESWKEMGIWQQSPLAYARDIQVAPDNPNTLYAALSDAAMGRNGSIYRSQDLGQTWKRFDHGLTVRSTMMTVSPSPRDPQTVFGATRKGQVFGTQDGGTTWAECSLPAARQDVYALACG